MDDLIRTLVEDRQRALREEAARQRLVKEAAERRQEQERAGRQSKPQPKPQRAPA